MTSDDEEFARLTDAFRPELLAYCYRMLGSVHDAEDQVQETLVRAWRSYDDFEGRASLRTWLYRIATNACLRALENRDRRPLPSGLSSPEESVNINAAGQRSDIAWLQPFPDALITSTTGDPAATVASRTSMRLALVAALQYLPPRQRAILLLRDVLGWRAAAHGCRRCHPPKTSCMNPLTPTSVRCWTATPRLSRTPTSTPSWNSCGRTPRSRCRLSPCGWPAVTGSSNSSQRWSCPSPVDSG